MLRPNRAAFMFAISYLVGALAFISDIFLSESALISMRTMVTALYAATAIVFSSGLWIYYRKCAPWRMMFAILIIHVALYAWLLHVEFYWMRSFSANFGCAILFSAGLLAFRGNLNRIVDTAMFLIHLANCTLCFVRPIVLTQMVDGAPTNANHSEELFVLTLHFFVATGAVVTAMGLLIMISKDVFEELQNHSMTDPLTSLLNRRGFDLRVEEMIDRAGAAPVCAIIGDIDHFKAVNDTFGHAKGDEVIARVGRMFGQLTNHERFSARFGGEEFVFLGRGLTLKQATALAEELRAEIENLNVMAGDDIVRCTASFGVALRLPGESPSSLLARADAALYLSKQAGRNRVYSETDTSVSWLRETHSIMKRVSTRCSDAMDLNTLLNTPQAR
ncbi:MAG: GGDEF domain-containing protein [Hyphomonadaceae bacterium]|nr:GGDEF domain-containing protein [Hyphomonadaceae bacterium]